MTQQKRLLAVVVSLFGFLACLYAAEPVYHIVKKGETLYAIAHTYNISVDELMQANKIKDAKTVQPGVKLLIPPSADKTGSSASQGNATSTTLPAPAQTSSYTVKKGDTLYSIAKQFATTVETIRTLNSLSSASITPGQKLKVPGQIPSTSPVAVVPPSAKPVEKVPDPIPATTVVATAVSTTVTSNLWPCAGELSYLQGKVSGVSIKAKNAVALSAVRAGIVVSAGPFRGYDNLVFVQASDGLIYVYGGLFSMRVKAGETVRRGTELGKLAASPESTAYFFVFKGSSTLDPAKAPRD